MSKNDTLNFTSQNQTLLAAGTNNKFNEEEYSNYIDSSQVIVESYKNSKVTGLEKYFLEIEKWLEIDYKDDIEKNKPLIIKADQGVGKKTLVVKWMEYHQENKKKDLPDIIIPHFASTGGNNSNYFFAIYSILIRLREILDISQKVELLEEKLRKYFAYWLNVCNNKIENAIIEDAKVIYGKIIIIIEGIDHFVDPLTQQEAHDVAFWLPRYFPNQVRFIITSDQKDENSPALAYFNKIQAKILEVPIDNYIVKDMIEQQSQQKLLINENLKAKHLALLSKLPESCNNTLFIKTYLAALMPTAQGQDDLSDTIFEKLYSKLDFGALEKIETLPGLFEFILEYYSQNIMDQEKFEKLVIVLILTQKGLTIDEIKDVTGITDDQEWKVFIACFKTFLMNYRELWLISNNVFKKAVQDKYCTNQENIDKLHEDIAEMLEKRTQNSIRKLEEQTFHLFKSKSYFKLKEIISAIENFLLLFNPNNKYDLCRYWQKLEEKGFDPVIEYNKAIEGFEMHYHPNSEDVFRIIVQISRFLKEFSDFETYFTPEFRHPPVQGTAEELEDIGLLRELIQLNIYYNKDMNDEQMRLKFESMDLQSQKSPEERIQQKLQKIKEKKNVTFVKKEKNEENGKDNEQQKKEKTEKEEKKAKKKIQILKEIEQLNVDIPSNREQFREYYMKELKDLIADEKKEEEQSDQYNLDQSFEEEAKKGEGDETNREIQDSKTDKKNSIVGKEPDQKDNQLNQMLAEQEKKKENPYENLKLSMLREKYNLQDKQPQNYYYKRWLWVQYPWACLSLKCDYSQKLKKCFSAPTQYMVVAEEKQFTKQALKIAIEAKLKKQMMYQKQGENQGQSIIIKTEISRISNSNSLPRLKPLQQVQSQNSTSKLPIVQELNLEQSQEYGIPKRTKGYAKSTMNATATKKEDNVPFFITEEYLNQNTLNKEIEINRNPELTMKATQQIKEVDLQNTSKMLEKSKIFKDKSKLFDPVNSISEATKFNQVLPRLKSQINMHSNREMYLLEQQSQNMQKEYDNLVYFNQCLAKKLRDLKIMEHTQNALLDTEKVANAQQKLIDLRQKIEETEDDYQYSLMQQERLKKILKICYDNKKQNEEWIRHLNYLLNNLRKMIKWEQDDIGVIQQDIFELKRINHSYLCVFNEKMQNHYVLIEHIKHNLIDKTRFDSVFNQSDTVIENSAINQVQKLKSIKQGQENKRKNKDKLDKLAQTSKQIQEQLEYYHQKYEQLREIIDIQDESYSQSETFKKFLAALEKKSELQSILLDRDNVIQQLKDKQKEQESYLSVISKANKNKEQQEVNEEDQTDDKKVKEQVDLSTQNNSSPEKIQEEYENIQRQQTRLTQSRLSCVMTIQTLQKKFKVEQSDNIKKTVQFESEPILKSLQEKLECIQQKLGQEEYDKFMSGDYDYNMMYKKLVVSYSKQMLIEDDQSSQREMEEEEEEQ